MQAIKFLAVLIAAATEALAEGGTRRLVVSLPDRKIALFENGRVVKIYPIAVGKNSTPSPRGSFHIASRVVKPTWYQPGKVVHAGPANPLGTRWMGLGYKGYGIHGTNRPKSIGKAASHGCIRMRNQDVEDLFERVEVGDPVELLTETSPELAEAFDETAAASAAAGRWSMRSLTFLGEFPEVAFALAFSFGCALLMAFACLRIVVRLVTREQYNVTDAPRRVRAIVWKPDSQPGPSAADAGSSGATGGPYLLPGWSAAPPFRWSSKI
jgi:hypothetical protein